MEWQDSEPYLRNMNPFRRLDIDPQGDANWSSEKVANGLSNCDMSSLTPQDVAEARADLLSKGVLDE